MHWSTILPDAGGIGGLVLLVGAALGVARGTFRQVEATRQNTEALNALREELELLTRQAGQHEIRLAVLEDRRRAR
jgi:hypothetical protein